MYMRFLRPGRLVIYAIVSTMLWMSFWSTDDIPLLEPVTIDPGETVSKLYNNLSRGQEFSLKRYIRNNKEDLKTLQPGTYVFSWTYSPAEIIDVLNEWPKVSYNSITVLEWWSIYDVDDMLTQNNYIERWEYIAFVRDQDIISTYAKRYDFVQQAMSDVSGSLKTLEGLLYPETYYIDTDKDVIDQLVYLQLETFDQKVRSKLGTPLSSMDARLQKLWFDMSLTFYGALRLASIIEKEERVDANKPLIASVFLNRINDGMRLDADISLCYGLNTWYEACTPAVIAQNLRDDTNVYNTRAVSGLPPTPISSVHIASLQALLDAKKTDNYYYLHDENGQIHPAKDLAEHNVNKSKYIK